MYLRGLFINVRLPVWLRYLPMVLAASTNRELDLVLRLSPGVRAWSPPSDVRRGSVRVIPHASMDSILANSDRGFMDRAWGNNRHDLDKIHVKKYVFIQKSQKKNCVGLVYCGIHRKSKEIDEAIKLYTWVTFIDVLYSLINLNRALGSTVKYST